MEKQRELKVGDRVQLKESSRFNNGSKNNPLNIKGKIIYNKGYLLPIEVKWDSNRSNTYDENDLTLIEEPKEVKILAYRNKLSGIISNYDEKSNSYITKDGIYMTKIGTNEEIYSVINNEGNTFEIGDDIISTRSVKKDIKRISKIVEFRYSKTNPENILAIGNHYYRTGVFIDKIEHFIEKELSLLDEARSKYSIGMTVKSVISNTKVEITDLNLIEISSNKKTIAYNNGQIIIYNGVDWAEEITETLLEKALRLYPIGTRIITAQYHDIRTIKNTIWLKEMNRISSYSEEASGHATIYYNGEWAKIIK